MTFRKTIAVLALITAWSLFLLNPAGLSAKPASLYESFRLLIQNQKNGEIALSVDKGASWQKIGLVTKAASNVNKKGFPRSAQAEDLSICEIASDRLMLKIGQNYEDRRFKYGRGTLFGLMALEAAHLQKQKKSDDAMIYTDIPVGSLIFGQYSPLLGNKFYIVDNNRLAYPAADFRPQNGDTFVIIVDSYPQRIEDIVFENRFGGDIVAHFSGGDSMHVGTVLRPVEGIGRFIGTELLEPGQVRQSHGSAIGVSTSRKIGGRARSLDSYRGGFQIVSAEHIYDPELLLARTSPQWMVVGPARQSANEFIDLQYPLFSGFVFPTMTVEVRIDKMKWEPFPEMTGSDPDAFLPQALTDYFEARYVRQGITHIRLNNANTNN